MTYPWEYFISEYEANDRDIEDLKYTLDEQNANTQVQLHLRN